MNKKNLIALALLGFLSLFAYIYNANFPASISPPPVSLTTVSSTGASVSTTGSTTTVTRAAPTAPASTGVTLKIGSATYAVPFIDGGTALDAMRTAQHRGFMFAGRDYPGIGFFVESIQGKENADNYYWILYLNGATSTLGASSLKLHASDVVEWRYEKGY